MFFHFFILTYNYRHHLMPVYPSCHSYIIYIQCIVALRASDTCYHQTSSHKYQLYYQFEML